MTGEKAMHKFANHARWAIAAWLTEQEKFAEGALQRDPNGLNHRFAVNILRFAKMMRFGLERYEEPEARRAEILEDLVTKWRTVHPGQSHPPTSVLIDLDVEASHRAFRERYPALARFTNDIAAMRSELERISDCLTTMLGRLPDADGLVSWSIRTHKPGNQLEPNRLY
jgi:hypothetical protein